MSYGTSPIRYRRSREEIERLDSALAEIVYEVALATVRQIFYQAVVRGLVPKDETKGYRVVQRRLLKLREEETIPYGLITDNPAWSAHAHAGTVRRTSPGRLLLATVGTTG